MAPTPLTAAREAQLLAHVPTLATLAEAQAFRDALREQGELSGPVLPALLARIEVLTRQKAVAR